MENNNKNRELISVLVGIVIGVVIAAAGIVIALKMNAFDKDPVSMNFEEDDTIAINGVDFPEIKSDYAVVLYSSSTNVLNDASLTALSRIDNIWGDKVEMLCVWEDKIPEIAENYNNVSLQGKYNLAPGVATYYLVDNTYSVVYKTTTIDFLVEEIYYMDLADSSVLRENADAYLRELYSTDDDKSLVINFALSGCEDCKAADEILEASEDIQNSVNIVKIYSYLEFDSEKLRDTGGVFFDVYGISWYPSFLVYNGSGETTFIGETPEDELEETILNALK